MFVLLHSLIIKINWNYFNRRLIVKLLIIIIISWISCNVWAQVFSACDQGLFNYAPVNTPAEIWEQDTTYTTTWKEDESGQDAILIVGDILHVNQEDFPFLFKKVSEPITGISKLVFDAREIVIEMPIRLADGFVSIFADRVSFYGNGAINFSRPPNVHDQGLEIITKILDLSRSGARPLEFTTRDWIGNEWPTHDGPHRRVIVRCDQVVPSQQTSEIDLNNLKERPARFIHNLSVDRSRSKPKHWMEMYDVIIGTEEQGQNTYDKHFFQSLVWPNYTAYKLGNLLAFGPYDKGVRTFVNNLTKHFSSRFAIRMDQQAFLKIKQINNAILSETDLRGFSNHDVSLISLPVLLERFERSVNSLVNNQEKGISEWDGIIVQSLRGSVSNSPAIQSLKLKTKEKESQINKLRNNIKTNIEKIAGINAQIDSQLQIVDQRRSILYQKTQEKSKQLRDADRIDEAVAVTQGLAVLIGTVYPAAAPAAMYVSQGLSVAGRLSAQHNRGGSITFTNILTTFAEVKKVHDAHKKRIESLRKAWNGDTKAKKGTGKNIGLEKAAKGAIEHIKSGFKKDQNSLKTFSESAKIFTDVVKEIQDNLTPPGQEISINLTEFEQQDQRLQSALAEIVHLRNIEANLLSENAKYNDLHNSLSGEIAVVIGDIDTLSKLVIDNPQERAKLLSVALWHREQSLDKLRSDAAMLLRSYRYFTGMNLELAPGQGHFGKPPPPDAISIENRTIDSVIAWQKTSLENLRFHYNTMISALHTAIANRQAELGSVGLKTKPFVVDKITSKRSPEIANFINEVNLCISRQVKGIDDFSPILIPFTPEPTTSMVPERVLDAVVSDVKFKNRRVINSGALRLNIIHPGEGIVFFGENCVFVRGIDANGSPSPWVRSWTHPQGSNLLESRLLEWRKKVDDIAWNFAYPYRTNYFLIVDVLDEYFFEPNKPPLINMIRLDFISTSH